MRAWQPEDPVDREEWERRAAAQAREFYSRRRPAPPPGPAAGKPPAEISPGLKGTPSPAEMPEENQKTAPGDPRGEVSSERERKIPAETRQGNCGDDEEKGAERSFPAETAGMNPKTAPGDPRGEAPSERGGNLPEETRRGNSIENGKTKPEQAAREKPAGGRSRIPAPGRAPRRPPLAPDQLLLLSLLFLLSQERADPRLLLAVAYILLAGEGGEERG